MPLNDELESLISAGFKTTLLGYVFNLTLLAREEIGDNHRRAKVALDALIAAFPPEWYNIAEYTFESSGRAVSERHALLALVSSLRKYQVNPFMD